MLTIAYKRVGNLVVLVHASAPPADAEFDEYIEFLAKQATPRTRILVFSRGGSPNAVQRKKVAEVGDKYYGGDTPTAVMTDSPVARGAVTAITWLLSKNKMAAFPLDKLEDALAFLQIPSAMTPEVRATIAKLEADMRAGVRTRLA